MSTYQFTTLEPEILSEAIAAAVKKQLQDWTAEIVAKPIDELMSREEAAEYLRVSISTINNWRRSGKLVAYGLGNRVFFKRSEVESSLTKLQ